ncbi:MAG: ADP-ribosylglycohydrolase family protein [Victivallaceae bacterium]|nr:ADP-ribosylglycohydrolase family protein [Victivallaceae bacterium]
MIEFNGKFRQQVYGCWLGKAIAGGLGAPFEGVPYSPGLTANELIMDTGPNDDLELQLIWLVFAEQHGLELDADKLSAAWLDIIEYGMDEYGVAIWNLRRGLKPPLSGHVDNWFKDGMGAAIRSEIWASLFPGKPDMAACFAGYDASVDHSGDGVWAEMFLAATESCAFELDSAEAAFNAGLKYIPADCRITAVVKQVMELYNSGSSLENVRAMIMQNFGSHNFTDCIMNLGFIVAAMLFGAGDFEKTVLIAINSGYDTDCSAATSGALFGILHGPESIPLKWRELANDNISVSDFLEIDGIPRSIKELTARTITLAEKLNSQIKANDCFPVYQPVTEQDYPFAASAWQVITDVSVDEAEELFKTGQGRQIEQFNGIHLNLNKFAKNNGSIDLFTWVTVPEDIDCRLMICSATGMTAWLDETMIINYHGRLKPLPAFHRTEGGSTVAVSLKGGQHQLLRVRLIYCRPPLELTVAFSDQHNQYLTDVQFTAF